MGRKPRQDTPGSWHHVLNRGIAKRPLFETRADIRFFLSRLAREVRNGRIEVHAYSILTTHFHLLLRSPSGEMSEALRQAQNAHSRRFNRMHRRDGALVRGRFLSRAVEDDDYWCTLVRYIDNNPRGAGIVSRSADYEFGSAYHYQRGVHPPWLERSRMEREACRVVDAQRFGPAVYDRAFGQGMDAAAETADLVERRMSARGSVDPLRDLIGANSIDVQRWMERKTLLADGHVPGLPVCTPAALSRALDREEREHGVWTVERGAGNAPALPGAFVGLAHDLAGLSWRELSERLGEPQMRCRRWAREHRDSLEAECEYRVRAARVVCVALEDQYGVAHLVVARRREGVR